jgi:hypothetical protein
MLEFTVEFRRARATSSSDAVRDGSALFLTKNLIVSKAT